MDIIDIFSKNTEVPNIMKILSPGAVLFRVDGQTDMTKLIVSFRNFANAHESGPRLRGHENRGIIHRNALLYRKISIRLELVRVD